MESLLQMVQCSISIGKCFAEHTLRRSTILQNRRSRTRRQAQDMRRAPELGI